MPANYVLLENVTLTATTASIVFDSIPQTGYTDLKLVFSARVNSASVWDNLNLTFNGTSTYAARSLLATGVASTSQSASALDRQYAGGNNNTANAFGNGTIYIPNYSLTAVKTVLTHTVTENNAASSIIGFMAGSSSQTAAINTITLTSGGSFLAGSS